MARGHASPPASLSKRILGQTEGRIEQIQPLRVKKHFDTFREKDCGLLKISQFSGRNPDQTNCFSAACALEKPDATYTPPRLIPLDVLRNLF